MHGEHLWGFFCSRNRKEKFLSDVIVATDAVFVDLESMGGCYCQLVERKNNEKVTEAVER